MKVNSLPAWDLKNFGLCLESRWVMRMRSQHSVRRAMMGYVSYMKKLV